MTSITTHKSGRRTEVVVTTTITPTQFGGIIADEVVSNHRTYAGGGDHTESTYYWAHNSETDQFFPITEAQYRKFVNGVI